MLGYMEDVGRGNTLLKTQNQLDLLSKIINDNNFNISNSLINKEISNVILDLFEYLNLSSELDKIYPSSIIINLPISSNVKINSSEFMNYYWSILSNHSHLNQLVDEKLKLPLLFKNIRLLKNYSKNFQNNLFHNIINNEIEWFDNNNISMCEYQLQNGINIKLGDINPITKLNQLQIRLTSLPLFNNNNNNNSYEKLFLVAKTIMEGGSVGNYTKYQIEQFCIENNIKLNIHFDKKLGLVIDIESPFPQYSLSKLSNIFQVFLNLIKIMMIIIILIYFIIYINYLVTCIDIN